MTTPGPMLITWIIGALVASNSVLDAAGREDIVFADFEGATYAPWKAQGKAFGDAPAEGTLPGQMQVSDYKGKRLVNSYYGRDGSTGRLASPEFKIERKFIAFLIGGGGHEGKTCVNLVIDGKIVRTATGPNIRSGGSEALEQSGWDVAELEGKTARIEVVDDATGGWGHINLDHVIFTDTKPATISALVARSRQITAEKRFLNFPVKNGSKVKTVKVSVDDQAVREFTIEAAEDQPDWWASLDISAWKGKTLTLDAGKLPETSKFIEQIDQGDVTNKAGADLYREPARPLIHFSPRRGWNNDPNGLVWFNGEYHLFFQFNPYGTKWGNMHWGHAVGRDLVRWEEIDVALYPDAMGPMFSGSAVVDWKNTSGFGKDGKPPLVLIYTAAGNPTTQCIAWSLDGRTFTKYEKNPVVPQITGGNRDPKVFWHEPTKKWIMTLYVGLQKPDPDPNAKKKANTTNTIHFLTSSNLKEWEVTSQIEGFYECPDFFPLAVDGDAAKILWVLTAASSEYMVGTFDGRAFTPTTPKLPGHRGRGFYAAQTFSDIPATDGRRIMIGWLRAGSANNTFNQAMSVPLELKLLGTPEGPRLSFFPAREIESLRSGSTKADPAEIKPGSFDLLAGVAGTEAMELRLELEPGADAEIELCVRGIKIGYNAAKQELIAADLRVPAPLRNGKLSLVILADRTCLEIFASEGLCYVPLTVVPRPEDTSVTLGAIRGSARLLSAQVHRLESMWKR